jgi:hypothetical protein
MSRNKAIASVISFLREEKILIHGYPKYNEEAAENEGL